MWRGSLGGFKAYPLGRPYIPSGRLAFPPSPSLLPQCPGNSVVFLVTNHLSPLPGESASTGAHLGWACWPQALPGLPPTVGRVGLLMSSFGSYLLEGLPLSLLPAPDLGGCSDSLRAASDSFVTLGLDTKAW